MFSLCSSIRRPKGLQESLSTTCDISSAVPVVCVPVRALGARVFTVIPNPPSVVPVMQQAKAAEIQRSLYAPGILQMPMKRWQRLGELEFNVVIYYS